LWFVALYPPVVAAMWIAGGAVFRLLDERVVFVGRDTWPGVTLLVPAYNEELVIGTCVKAALALDYPSLEILVLDDGSTDGTAQVATEAAVGDRRVTVLSDAVNLGKADRLNLGFARATYELVAVIDADTHLEPSAMKFLVARIDRSPRIAAVAGSAHVTNRTNLSASLQIVEAASIIGLIRRTQAVIGTVGVVAGVLGLFRRDAVVAAGGYDPRMATEDIDLSWRLLIAGWDTTFEPHALVGMQVPTTLGALWKQRCRWARGQGEVLHRHLRRAARKRHMWLWPLAFEALASLVWALAFVAALVVAAVALALPNGHTFADVGIAWGVAIAVVATLQAVFALSLGARSARLEGAAHRASLHRRLLDGERTRGRARGSAGDDARPDRATCGVGHPAAATRRRWPRPLTSFARRQIAIGSRGRTPPTTLLAAALLRRVFLLGHHPAAGSRHLGSLPQGGPGRAATQGCGDQLDAGATARLATPG
jgi:biofilm PGA synthesis N-glycosyltransferase PgaC